MCMEDIKIGRNLQSQFRTITADNVTPTRLLSADPNRVSFTVGTTSTGRVSIFPLASTTLATSGFGFSIATPPIKVDLDSFGSMVQQEWFGMGAAAPVIISVVENSLIPRKSSDLT